MNRPVCTCGIYLGQDKPIWDKDCPAHGSSIATHQVRKWVGDFRASYIATLEGRIGMNERAAASHPNRKSRADSLLRAAAYRCALDDFKRLLPESEP